jgi:2-amino-4-hydroxy-6-hydroxymethyldihydropteridine diphosphokinase
MEAVYIALGSNMGDREAYLSKALGMLAGVENVRLAGLSGIYQTAAVGYTDQATFLNMVCRAEVSVDPFALLEMLQNIERALERKRTIHWGPRTIDLDILLYGSEKIHTSSLTIPHPCMFERAFVLVPLRDVYPSESLDGISFTERIGACPDRDGIALYRRPQEAESLLNRVSPVHSGPY